MIPVWSPEAVNDLVALRAYIEQDGNTAQILRIFHGARRWPEGF
ncbi:hypothetical protein SAMN05444159_2732 [Bradyrhizobium lablabi]|uniref:Type II toxin-antitoxin system RelE/ParE family toxin n=1 Tax=Bradyrhizobium lablabi TaxID=722472 RepID=A0A1M6QNS4_9BRAD|nr:hypothetical protein SAMN05444159_2732 [Bradyrhizobium lablabi]